MPLSFFSWRSLLHSKCTITKVYSLSDYIGGGAFARHFFTYLLRLTTTLFVIHQRKNPCYYTSNINVIQKRCFLHQQRELSFFFHNLFFFFYIISLTQRMLFSLETTCVVFFTLFKKYIRQRGTQISLSLG